MSEDKKFSWVNFIKGFIPYFATPALVVTVLWKVATYTATSEAKQFDSPEQKVEHINHVKSSPNEVDNYKAYQRLDSIARDTEKNSQDAIRSRAVRDSIMKENTELAEKNAVQIYQFRQVQDTILKLLKKNNNN